MPGENGILRHKRLAGSSGPDGRKVLPVFECEWVTGNELHRSHSMGEVVATWTLPSWSIAWSCIVRTSLDPGIFSSNRSPSSSTFFVTRSSHVSSGTSSSVMVLSLSSSPDLRRWRARIGILFPLLPGRWRTTPGTEPSGPLEVHDEDAGTGHLGGDQGDEEDHNAVLLDVYHLLDVPAYTHPDALVCGAVLKLRVAGDDVFRFVYLLSDSGYHVGDPTTLARRSPVAAKGRCFQILRLDKLIRRRSEGGDRSRCRLGLDIRCDVRCGHRH